eukprot:TRINITY_DN2744_c0_g1_i1.p1 TRINITY_DN2744_c0_g1~~TRINITY_DN2744_c0_g1_i1.p1  ORF type:complete len:1813 (+),score=542.23 TRINITY_DN2744_c0_g1_i1:25-5439(+)
MAQIPLRIVVPSLDTSKVLKFDSRMTIKDVIAHIHEKIPNAQGEHGIFQPLEDGTGRWFKEDKTLVFYDMKQNDSLEFRKKQRTCKVKLMDDSTKTMMIDESIPVAELVKSMAKKIGIQNTEEFSLKVDGTGDAEWLNPNTSLHEQGVKEKDVLVLKKKFFFSDANIDTNDPVELHLLFVQANKNILNESHRCGLEEAIKLAGLRLQAEYGNHNPNKHKPGFVAIEELVPASFRKVKNIEKDIFAEHRKLSGLSDVQAKFRYVQQCRQLKTYGITFFTVKEKPKNKKGKPDVRILGVTRDSIMRMDPETKAVIANYPLTHLRRWAANPGTFTLDFGDYEDEYMTMLTDEGEAISNLIAGYIDIILQKRREAALGAKNQGDEAIVAEEELLAPAKGRSVITQGSQYAQGPQQAQFAQGGAMQGQMSGMGMIGDMGSFGDVGQLAQSTMVLSELDGMLTSLSAQAANLSGYSTGDADIEASLGAIMGAAAELSGTPGDTARFGAIFGADDAQQQLAAFGEQIARSAAILCSTGDPQQMMMASQQMSAACANLVGAAKAASPAIGAKDPAAQQRLIEAARLVAAATNKLVAASHDPDGKQKMVTAAREIAAATAQLISAADVKGSKVVDMSPQAQQARALIDATRAVTDATTRLMATAKATASTSDPENCKKVVEAAKLAAVQVQELVAASKIAADRVAMSINDPKAQADLLAACKNLGGAVAGLVSATQAAAAATGKVDPAHQQLLAYAAKSVADAISMLVATSKSAAASVPVHSAVGEFQDAQKQVNTANAELLASLGPGGTQAGVLNAAKAVATSSSKLVNAARSQANRTLDEDRKRALTEAAQKLGDQTGALVAAVRDAAVNMSDEAAATAVRTAIVSLDDSAQDVVDQQLKFDLIDASKDFAEATTGLIGSAKTASASASAASQQQFIGDARPMAEAVAALLAAKQAPDGPDYLASLVAAAKKATGAANNLITSAKAVSGTATDRAAARNLDGSIEAANAATGALMQSAKNAGTDQKDLDEIIAQACEVNGATVQLVNASRAGDAPNFLEAAKRSAMGAGDLVNLVQQKSHNIMDPDTREQVQMAAKAVAGAVTTLVPTSKQLLSAPEDVEKQRELAMNTKSVSRSIAHLVDTARAAFEPAHASKNVMAQHDAIQSAADITAATMVDMSEDQGAGCPAEMSKAAAQLSNAMSKMMLAMSESPEAVIQAAKDVELAVAAVDGAAAEQLKKTGNPQLGSLLRDAAKNVANAAGRLQTKAKHGAPDPLSQEEVARAARDLTRGAADLVDASRVAASVAPLEQLLASYPSTNPQYKQDVYAAAADLRTAVQEIVDAKSQGDLIAAAKKLALHSQKLATSAKDGAGACTDAIAQQQLLDSAKAVADGTSKLITAAKASVADPSLAPATNRAARDLTAAATNACTAADAAASNSPAETLVAHAKAVVASTVRLVSGEDQDEIQATSKALAQSSARLGAAGRNMAAVTLDETIQSDLFDSTSSLADHTGNIVSTSRTARDAAQRNKLIAAAQNLVASTKKLVVSGQQAGAAVEVVDEADESERELAQAAKAVEALTAKLLQPKSVEELQSAGLGEREAELSATISEFAKAIAVACGTLLSAARASQREIASMRKAQPTNTFYSKDPAVLEGLIGSAKAVVTSTSMLVDSSNDAVMGNVKEEKMIASAQGVAAATAQLVANSRVKAKPGSKNQEKLQSAARAVQQASATLVNAAKASSASAEIDAQAKQPTLDKPMSYTQLQTEIINAQARVLELEKQLAQARAHVQNLRKAAYHKDSEKPSGPPPAVPK